LLHGFPLNNSMWRFQIEHLSKSHRVIAPDLRGHGGSSVTEGSVTMNSMANDVANLLSALEIDQPVTLCGLSMGGYVAWEFWRHHRDRLSALILCDTRAVADTEEVARARQMMAAQVVHAGSTMAAESMVPKVLGQVTLNSRIGIVEEVRNMILDTDPVGIAATQRGMAERIDMTPHLKDVDVPSLVICGEDDTISPPDEMQQIAQALPQATYREIEAAGHLAPLENPEPVNKAIDEFLATL
jgi:pimeloyl-ACP methyl ester carboxylesterase